GRSANGSSAKGDPTALASQDRHRRTGPPTARPIHAYHHPGKQASPSESREAPDRLRVFQRPASDANSLPVSQTEGQQSVRRRPKIPGQQVFWPIAIVSDEFRQTKEHQLSSRFN